MAWVRKLRQHWYLERESSLPPKVKEAFLARHGELYCKPVGFVRCPPMGIPWLPHIIDYPLASMLRPVR
jgi:hypothetical protein